MLTIHSINEVSGFRFEDNNLENKINKMFENVDGYKKCNIYIEGYKQNKISKALNVVLIFDKNYELANIIDGTMNNLDEKLYLIFSKNFYIIRTYILWK